MLSHETASKRVAAARSPESSLNGSHQRSIIRRLMPFIGQDRPSATNTPARLYRAVAP